MTGMLQHIIYITPWPVPFEIALQSSIILDTVSRAAGALVEVDRLFKDKTRRTGEIIVMYV